MRSHVGFEKNMCDRSQSLLQFKTCGQSGIKQNCGPKMTFVLPDVRGGKKKEKIFNFGYNAFRASEMRLGCEDHRIISVFG